MSRSSDVLKLATKTGFARKSLITYGYSMFWPEYLSAVYAKLCNCSFLMVCAFMASDTISTRLGIINPFHFGDNLKF